MTDIIEARARAICEAHPDFGKDDSWETWPDTPEEGATMAVSLCRQDCYALARATLAADRAAGYWLAPNEPTEVMLKAAEADEDEWRFMPRPKDRIEINLNVMRDAFLRDACKEDSDANS